MAKTGAGAGVKTLVTSIVGLLLIVVIGAMVFYEVVDSIEGTSSEVNDTKDKAKKVGGTVFGLLILLGLLLVAVALINVFGGI